MFEKIGFTSVTFRDKSIKEIIDIAHRNKIDYIEWGSDVHIKCDNDILEHYNASQKTAIPTSSYGSYYRVGDNDMLRFKNLCYIAGQLKAKIIRVWLGNKASEKYTDLEINNMIEEVKSMSNIAAQVNVLIAFEFHKDTLNDNAKSCISFLRKVNKENVKTYWQPMGDFEKDLMTLTEICYYVVGIHVFYWLSNGIRRPLKKGKKYWSSFFDLLCDRRVHPIIIMEFVKGDKPAQFAKDVATLRKLLGRYN